MASVALVGLSKRFGDVVAVNNVTFAMEDGEFVVLAGPSGCGKTSILRMIAGLEKPSTGEIRIGERTVNRLAPAERNVAMVFQNFALYPHMSVYRNIASPLEIRRLPRHEVRERVMHTAALLQIDELLDRMPRQLSGGQQQRVALGRAIVREPLLLLLDEPLSNLDAKLRVQMRTELKQLQKRLKTSTIYVTHDQTEAMTMGDRIIVMNRGIVQQVGTPENIYNAPANIFVAGLIGSPAMNFLQGEVRAVDASLRLQGQDVVVRLTGKQAEALRRSGLPASVRVIVGIRPEHLKVRRAPERSERDLVIRGSVEIVQRLGSETLVRLSCADGHLMIRMDPDVDATEGERLEVAVSVDRIRLFNPDTEERVA